MHPAKLDLCIAQGATYSKPLLLMQPDFAYRPIAAFLQTAPARLTVPGHGLPGDWPTWIEGVSRWGVINRDKEREPFRVAKVIDADTVEYNALNGIGNNAAGGFLVYRLPVELAGARARMQVRDRAGALLLDLSTEAGGLVIGTGRITLTLTAAQTAALTWTEGRYDLEVEFADGTVQRWAEGIATVRPEVTHG
ncbi:hypothetical protein DN824_20465 [Stutzerimonas nosocomialis]|uniref:hypothetical protein n=1 Tax=Stutzerimonas nosocomialis TaxID=1056496 RepID=UPI001107F375|nr:hypothetical protein [Stutzerimonas nosocomialis]TLX54859.1 hypothetical protein DN824_20465 [Stutzerimonas nosocomialis]